jgi:Ras-related protein Rab-5C/Ras-related protein Rab-22
VSTAEARAYAEEIGALFIETSAKVNKGVQDVFVDISHRLPQPQESNFGEVADLRDTRGKDGGKKKEGGCC